MKVSKFPFLLFYLLLKLCIISANAQSGVFVGGPAYIDRDFSINELKASGFTHVKVWTIHINVNGDLNFNGEFLICKDGKYVGDESYPQFRNDMKMLKTQPTSVVRIEFGLSAWASATFDNIKSLIEAQGTDNSSILHKNFKALKEAIPEIDAINNDDEKTYDLNSSIEFSKMLFDIGYKLTCSPYIKMSYWQDLVRTVNTERPGAFDIVYVQCYAGGAGNNPCTWKSAFDSIPVYGGLWAGEKTEGNTKSPNDIENLMTSWAGSCGLDGGFLWLYDYWKNTDLVETLASGLNHTFSITPDIDTLPYPANSPNPRDASTSVAIDTILQWTSDELAESHNVYFGANSPPTFIGNQSSTKFAPDNLAMGKNYYWRVDEVFDDDTICGQEWSFKTILLPDSAMVPVPADGTTNVGTNITLRFNESANAEYYRIFIDTTTNFTSGRYLYELKHTPKNLLPYKTYFWQIESINFEGSTLGKVWEFSTGSSSLVNSPFSEKEIIVYPNPGNSWINIKYEPLIESITITNMLGQTIREYTCSVNRINISDLRKGPYILQLNNSYSTIFYKL